MELVTHITIVLVSIGFVSFVFVIAFGAPFLPTLKKNVEPALDMLDLKPGQMLLELGCGDGRLMLAAAKRGVFSKGYELNPILVFVAKLRTWRYRSYVQVEWGNYWGKKWPKADGIYAFILTNYMPKLDKCIIQYPHKPVKLLSFAFPVTARKPVQEKHGLFLYYYK